MGSDAFNTWVAVIGVIVAALGLFAPNFLSQSSSRRAEFRKQSAPVLEKLLIEISAVRNGAYPFQTIREEEIYRILTFVGSSRKRKALESAYQHYREAHKIAKTTHWHDVHPPENIYFVTSFIVNNPDEVLKKMKHLEKALLR